MTKKDVSELFSLVMTAWPHAEICKADIDDLDRTITLWQICLNDVEAWVGMEAIIRLCKKLKFAPTIAELREEAGSVKKEIESVARFEWDLFLAAGPDEYRSVFNRPESREVLKAMESADGNWYQFLESYFTICRSRAQLSLSNNQSQRRLT